MQIEYALRHQLIEIRNSDYFTIYKEGIQPILFPINSLAAGNAAAVFMAAPSCTYARGNGGVVPEIGVKCCLLCFLRERGREGVLNR